MADITHGVWIKDGEAIDKAFSNGKQVYGRNLLTGTSNVLTTVPNATFWGPGVKSNSLAGALKANRTYTLSCYLEPAEHDGAIVMHIAPHAQHYDGNIFGTVIAAGSKGLSTLTVTLTPDDIEVFSCWVSFASKQTDESAFSYKGFKLEKGSVATPWSPAPEDILN